MRITTLTPIIVCIVSGGFVLALFQSGASPYITVAQARKLSGDQLNLGVDIDKTTINVDLRNHETEFYGVDKDGERVKIRYIGDPIDLKTATRANCVGKLQGSVFVSDRIMLKCPSKYEESKSSGTAYEAKPVVEKPTSAGAKSND